MFQMIELVYYAISYQMFQNVLFRGYRVLLFFLPLAIGKTSRLAQQLAPHY